MDEMIFKEFQKQNEQIEAVQRENELLRKMLGIRQEMHDTKW